MKELKSWKKRQNFVNSYQKFITNYVGKRLMIIENSHFVVLVERLSKAENDIKHLRTLILCEKEFAQAKTSQLSFGEAIQALKNGAKIGRWHRDDIYIWLREACSDSQACLMVNTVNGEIYPWTPNQQEILAENWRIIDESN